MMRALVERLSRGIVLKRRLPASVGGAQLYVSPDAQLKYLKVAADAFDTGLLQLAQDHVKSDSIVWDVGANVGVFTFAAAGLAKEGHVFAIEADSWLADLIRRSCRLHANRTLAVTVLSAAVSATNGVAEFVIARRGRASNYLANAGGWSQSGGERERTHVATLTLDSLLESFTRPTFLKIDVEGAEVMVLRGATRLLNEVRPALYIEVGQENSDAVTRMLHASNYRLFDSTRPMHGQQPLAKCVQDTLAIPA
jgi:FkbM family methyltransferase